MVGAKKKEEKKETAKTPLTRVGERFAVLSTKSGDKTYFQKRQG